MDTNETTGQPDQPRINPAIAAEIDSLMNEAASDNASQAEEKRQFDNSPEGRWRAAITDIAPLAEMIHPDMKTTPEEAEALAIGLAPALAKHFPNMDGITIPVELIAAYTVWTVYGPKVRTIREKRAAALKEVNPDATPEST